MKKNKNIHLVYNPSAGTSDESKHKEVIAIIEAAGYRCAHFSSKRKKLKTIEPQINFIAIAGGDGTVRKMTLFLLNKKLKYKRPIAILPCGTANNIATSLGITQSITENVASWSNYYLKKFDVGQVSGLDKANYFIESFGFGLFPKLMKVLKKKNTDNVNTPEEEFNRSLKQLLKQTKKYEAVPMLMKIDDKVIEEDCILVEVMNISSLGPRLNLSNAADPGDGYFDVIIVSAAQRTQMEKYLLQIIEKGEAVFPIKPIRVQSLEITWKGKDVHVDDEIIENYKKTSLHISMMEGLLEMVLPQKIQIREER